MATDGRVRQGAPHPKGGRSHRTRSGIYCCTLSEILTCFSLEPEQETQGLKA